MQKVLYIFVLVQEKLYINTGCPNFNKEFLKTDYLTAILDYIVYKY